VPLPVHRRFGRPLSGRSVPPKGRLNAGGQSDTWNFFSSLPIFRKKVLSALDIDRPICGAFRRLLIPREHFYFDPAFDTGHPVGAGHHRGVLVGEGDRAAHGERTREIDGRSGFTDTTFRASEADDLYALQGTDIGP